MLPQAEAIGTNTFYLLPLASALGRTADLKVFFLLKHDRKTLFLIYMLLLVVDIRKKLRSIKQIKVQFLTRINIRMP